MISVDRDDVTNARTEATDCEPCDLGVWRGILFAIPPSLAFWAFLAWLVWG